MKNIKKPKSEEMNKKMLKNENIKSKDEKREKKKSRKKRKRVPKGVILPPEMGPKMDFSNENCQEKS